MAMPRKWPRGYYSYILCFPDGTPYYVGAGKGNRARPQHKRFNGACIEVELRKIGKRSLVVIMEHDTKQAAFAHEEQLILRYGRRDLNTGVLLNRTNGRGQRGNPPSLAQRERLGLLASSRVWSDEERDAARNRMLGNTIRLGVSHTEETKALIGAKGRGRKLVLTDAERARRAKALQDRNRTNPPRKGKPCSSEHCGAISRARRK